MADKKSQMADRLGRGIRWVLKRSKKSTAVGAGFGVLTGAVIGVLMGNLVLWLIVGLLVFSLGGVSAGSSKDNGG